MEGVFKHWDRLLREVFELPVLVVFKRCVDEAFRFRVQWWTWQCWVHDIIGLFQLK